MISQERARHQLKSGLAELLLEAFDQRRLCFVRFYDLLHVLGNMLGAIFHNFVHKLGLMLE